VRKILSKNGKFMPDKGDLTKVKLLYFPVPGNAHYRKGSAGNLGILSVNFRWEFPEESPE
jgi:hypothetical protein